jgi:TonB family protein
MIHGSEHYFTERGRFRTRVSTITVVVAFALFAILALAQVGVVRRALNNPEHFGFEGPDRYVRRIELEQLGTRSGDSDAPIAQSYVPRASRGHGHGSTADRIRSQGAHTGEGPLGPGDDPSDLIGRALRQSSNTPLIQSEELIFERLVRPHYPEEARAQGIEGKFAILALIDSTGRVVQVQLQSGDPNGLLETEAAAAVRACVIRPYRVAGHPHEIVARFPFNFYLRD